VKAYAIWGFFRSSILCLLWLALTACTNVVTSTKGPIRADSTPDADAVELVAMGEQALQIAQKEAAVVVLRQVDTDLSLTDFRFVDGALTKEIMVVVPAPGTPADQWYTVDNSVSPLLSPSGSDLNLQNLKAGPNRVAQAITAHWPGCAVHGMTLYRENNQLTWTAFCNTSEGSVSGDMDAQTGLFQPSDAPPASLPVTATPAP